MDGSTPTPYRTGTPGAIPDGLEAVQHGDNYPEVVHVAAKEDYSNTPAPAYPPPEKKILGLRVTTFILALLLLLTVIIAAVAGGVSGSIAVNGAYNQGLKDGAAATVTVTAGSTQTSGSSPTSTSDRIATPPTEGTMELDCPKLTDTTRRVTAGGATSLFRATCGVNYPFADITRIPAYSFQDCLIACVAWNIEQSGNLTCNGVIFGAELGPILEAGGNCWLKTDFGDAVVVGDDGTPNNIVAGERIV